MANPYHDAEGKFCSKGEMKRAYEKLGTGGDLEGYFKLRNEYEAISKEMAPFEKEVALAAKTKGAVSARKPKVSKQFTPIEVQKTPLEAPRACKLYSVEYDYDGYGTPSWVNMEDDDGYGRNDEYDNLRVMKDQSIDVREVLSSTFGTSKNNIPEELVTYATDELGMDKTDAYEAVAERGYYGEEASVQLQSHNVEALTEWYQKLSNAQDKDGILDYARSKGTDTTGKTPLEAIKTQLAAENNGKVIESVKTALSIGSITMTPKKIVVPNPKHFDQVEATPIQTKNSTSDDIIGVVVEKGDEFVLIDGYHRYKKALENPRKQGKYIVLSPDRYGPKSTRPKNRWGY